MVWEAFIVISTKNQIWDTFFSFCLLLLIRLSSNYLFFFKIWGLSLVANQFPFLFRHKALSTMLSQIQSSISSSQGMVFCRCSHSSQWFNAGLFSWNGVQGSNWDSSVIFLLGFNMIIDLKIILNDFRDCVYFVTQGVGELKSTYWHKNLTYFTNDV